MHEHAQVALLLGKKTKGNIARCFHTHFSRSLKGAFFRISLISTGRNSRLKPGKLLNLIGHIGKKTGQFSLSLL